MRYWMRGFFLSLVALSVVGCGFDDQPAPQSTLWNLFPYDGNRTWEYVNLDTELSWTLVADMRSDEPEKAAGVNIYTLDYSKHCVGSDPGCVEGDLLRTVKWSSDAVDGVEIHGWTEAGGVEMVFDPPILISQREGRVLDVNETTTGGQRWTSELSVWEPCPVRITVNDWPDCARFTLDDNDGDALTGVGLVGDYWAVRTFGVVAISLPGTPEDVWELLEFDCEPDEECDGTW